MMATAMDAETARVQLLPIILDMAADVVCFERIQNKNWYCCFLA